MNRLECKLKEIILDSREGHQSNYSKSLREDHLHGSAFGKNAFTFDDSATGTTIFMPWKLHRPLELTFYKHAENSVMSHDSFKNFVDDYDLFPNFQNTRKKEDTLDYILKKANGSDSPLNFEEFLFALFLLAKYRSSVTHINEQYSFNNVINTVLTHEFDFNGNLENAEFDLNLQNLKENNLTHTSSTKNIDGVIYHDNGLIVDTKIGKVYESPRKLETKNFEEQTSSKLKQPKSPSNNTGYFDADLVKRLLDVLRDQNLLNDSKDLHERFEKEVRLRNELELSYHERLNKLDSEKAQLNNDYVLTKVKLGKLESDFESLQREYEDYKNEKKEQLNKYMNENEELTEKLDRINFLTTRNQTTQQKLVLETELEVKLFSIFCLYKDENCLNGEFVLSEEQLISFCVDFGLGESEPPSSPEDDPKAKRAYNKVKEYSYQGKLTYGLFKEFLSNFGLMLKPQLRQEEAFRFIVFQLVFSSTSNQYGEEQVEDFHPVYVTESNNPWECTSNNQNSHFHSHFCNGDPHHNRNQFLDMEGRVWFNNPAETGKVTGVDSPSTPRGQAQRLTAYFEVCKRSNRNSCKN